MSMSIKTKLTALITVMIIIGIAFMALFSSMNMKKAFIDNVNNQLKTNLEAANKFLDEEMPGKWSIENNSLVKGSNVINDNFEIVDRMASFFGMSATVTIFQGDTRVTTNVMKEGKRAVGTKVSDSVKQKTFIQGETFIGEADVVGVKYQSIYQPIKNGSGDIIGILYIGTPIEFIAKTTGDFQRKVILYGFIGLALLVLMTWFLVKRGVSTLIDVSAVVSRVADGDLLVETLKVKSKDEIGQLSNSINKMVLNLRKTVNGILTSAESVSAAAQQISASTQEIASGNATQANAAETMNELFKELSDAINSVARSAEQASDLSNKTMSIAQDGGKVIRSSIDGMNHVNQQMSRLEEDSNKIGEIIEVIDDIADQTNLLALNAAIEAARAGDQGRGFSVVADEVRKLAERSSEATKQITSIIKGMQENTRQSVKAVGEGVTSSQKTGEAFDIIITMVNDSAHKVTEIAAASEEQAAQSSEVMASIESISAATEEAAASSEETASTAQSLAELAEELNKSVSIFKVS